MRADEAAEAIGNLNIGLLSDGDGDETPPAAEVEGENVDTTPESGAADTETSDAAAPEVDESSTESQKADTSDEQPEGETEETVSIQTLSELTEALEVEPEFVQNLMHTFNADGEEVTVTLAELTKGYQKDANYRRGTAANAEMRRELEAKEAELTSQYQQQLAVTGQVLQNMKQVLVGEADSAKMQTLRETNPAEWAAQREEYQKRIQGFDQGYQWVSQQFDQAAQQQQQLQQAKLQELQEQELEKLRTAMPDWGDSTRNDLLGYLETDLGFSADELNSVLDHRLIVIADKARKYDAMQKAGKQTKKKVTALPRVQKPAAKRQVSPKVAAINKARQRFNKTGKMRDAADVIGSILGDDY